MLLLFRHEGELVAKRGHQQIREFPRLLVDVDVDSTIVCDFCLGVEAILAHFYLVVFLAVGRWCFGRAIFEDVGNVEVASAGGEVSIVYSARVVCSS